MSLGAICCSWTKKQKHKRNHGNVTGACWSLLFRDKIAFLVAKFFFFWRCPDIGGSAEAQLHSTAYFLRKAAVLLE